LVYKGYTSDLQLRRSETILSHLVMFLDKLTAMNQMTKKERKNKSVSKTMPRRI